MDYSLPVGPDVVALGEAATLLFPISVGEAARFSARSVSGTFTDAGGTYTDNTWHVGYNLDSAIAEEPSLAINLESKFRQSATSPYASELILSWDSPGGTYHRRPYQFNSQYETGLVSHAFQGEIYFCSSAGAAQAVLSEAGKLTFMGGGRYLILGAGVTAIDIRGVGTDYGGGVMVFDANSGYIQKTMHASADWAYVINDAGASATVPFRRGGNIGIGSSFWNGTASVRGYSQISARHRSATVGDHEIAIIGGLSTTRSIHVDGKQVVGARQSAIPNPVTIDDVIANQIAILNVMRTHGLIAPDV